MIKRRMSDAQDSRFCDEREVTELPVPAVLLSGGRI
jgi:hypothetical protein